MERERFSECSRPAIGIDLGMTNSRVAVWKDDHVEVIANADGGCTTPCYVCFTDKEIIVGDAARNAIDRTNVIYAVKRFIGRRFSDPAVEEDTNFFPFNVVSTTEDKLKFLVQYKGENKLFSAEEISSIILAKMKQIADKYLDFDVKEAVITVPACFSDQQRQATKEAGRLAGLNVMLLMDETSAAALAYYYREVKDYTGKQHILVFDLGRDTFDVSLVDICGGHFEVKETTGDTHLGGEDFVLRVLLYLKEELKRKHGKNIMENPTALYRLKHACEIAKRSLSNAKTATIHIDYLYPDLTFSYKLNRDTFEKLNEDLFKRCIHLTGQCLEDAGVVKTDVHIVLLIGGSTRIPKVQNLIEEYFGKGKVRRNINEEEAVAYGAAIQAAKLSGHGSGMIDNIFVNDVTPLSLGTDIIQLAKKLERKEQENRVLKETLQREKQEKDQLRQETEDNKKFLSEEIEKLKIEIDLHKRKRDEYFNHIQVANQRKLALEKQVADSQLVIKDLKLISESTRDHNESLQAALYKLEQEKDNLVRKFEELSTHSSSTAALNSVFSLQELEQATQSFSESLKIGEGGFGRVYKGSLQGTTVAIKLLNSQSLQGKSQFEQEVTILTKVRHPHLVTLIGVCPEASALIYEYLSNGSLEDRLTCANNTPPLTWQTRTRIIAEICLALIFLHSNKPKLVVHGDLKPENILLDNNLVSKLGDFGISRLIKQPDTNITAIHQTSTPAGTFAYIDPEYLETGVLTPKSDIYSFGIIILRLLTGKPARNIAMHVQEAIRDDMFPSVIDESAGAWPFEQAKELANIALRCTNFSRGRRPNLVDEVWAVVEPLMKAASTCEEGIPSNFICPIYQQVMQDPCIAADGFTYERDAISKWLRGGHNTSPMTNLALPNKNVIPNYSLRSVIQEWLLQHSQS